MKPVDRKTLTWADVTPKAEFLSRRQVMAGAAALGLSGLAWPAGAKIAAQPSKYSTDLPPNTFEEITG